MSIHRVVEVHCDNCMRSEIFTDFSELGDDWAFFDSTGTRRISLNEAAEPFERQHQPETESSDPCLCKDCVGKKLQWNPDDAEFEPVPPSAQMTLDEVIH